jgi:hypothetical protein
LIDLPPAKSKNKRRKLVDIPENLAAWLTPQAKTEGSIMPRAKVQVAMANAVVKAGIEWPHNCLRHSFLQSCCSVARLYLDKPASRPFGKNLEGPLSRSRY